MISHDRRRPPPSSPSTAEHGGPVAHPAGHPDDEGVPRVDDMASTPPQTGGGEQQAEVLDAACEALHERAGTPAGHDASTVAVWLWHALAP